MAAHPRDLEPCFPSGGGEIGELIRRVDWSATPLGPIGAWSPTVRVITQMLMPSPIAAVALFGREGIMVYNAGYAQVCGPRHPTAMGRSALDVWPEARDFNADVLARCFGGETLVFHEQELVLMRTGRPERVWMDLQYSPIVELDGAIIGVLATVIESTERVLAERQTAETGALLRFLDDLGRAVARAASADEVLAITTRMTGEHLGISNCAYADMDEDEDGFTIRGNWHVDGSRSIVGHYSLAAFGAKAVAELHAGRPLVIDDNLAELAPHEAKTFRDIGIAATICMPLIKEGRLTALMAIHDAAPRRWTDMELTTIAQVTERSWVHIERVRAEAELRRSAEALRELNATLESRVEERTRQLGQAEEALRQSQKLESMGQLTGGVAHDFNNLLTPIVGSLDLLQRKGVGGPREQRMIDGALQSAEKARTLVHRLLAFARRQPLQPVPVDLHRLVGEMAELIASTSGPRVRVAVDVSQALPPVLADPNQVEMAILNLAVNARDAMPDGGQLTIAAQHEASEGDAETGLSPGSYVRLSVSDTGTGMDEETRLRATEPFFSTKGVGKGTGLGLSMVHGLAAQLGGALRIASKPGLGTTVELWLPIATAPAAGAVAETPGPDAPGAGRVLLVDDDELVRASTAAMLADIGFEVAEAASGEDAMKLLGGKKRYRLLVTDHLMPGMSGAELARAAGRRIPDLPVLIVTGYAGLDEIAPDLRRLAKPFRQADLSAAIAELFAG